MSEQPATLDDFVANTDEAPNEKEVPQGWRVARADEIMEITRGASPRPKGDPELFGGGIPWVKIGDVDVAHERYTGDTEDTVTEKGAEKSKLVDPDTLLVSNSGTCGYPIFAGLQSCVHDGWLILRDFDDILNPHFLYEYIYWKQNYLKSLAPGSTQINLNTSRFGVLEIDIPPLEEQRKIASVLYTVDQVIKKAEEIIDQIERTQQGLEKRLFREGVFEHEDIEKKRLVTLPSNWDYEKLSELTQHSAFGPRFGSERYDDDGEIGILRTTDLNDRGHITLESMPLADLDRQEVEEHLLEPGDFMITRSGTTGIGAVWKGHDKPTIPGAFLIRFRLNNTLDPHFLKYYVNSSVGRRRVNRRAKGGVQKNLAGSDLLNMRFPVPSKQEQKEIVEILESVEERIKLEKQEGSQLQRLKHGLMQDLLKGKIRTHDKEIEVVNEILVHG